MSDDGVSDPERMIHEMQRYVKQTRGKYVDEMAQARLTTQTRRELATAAVKYWDMLHEHQDETILDPGDFPDIEPIERRLGRHVETTVPSKRRGKTRATDDVPAIDELDPNYCVKVTRQLDKCAKKLGFGASVKDQLNSFGVDPTWEEDDGHTAD